MLSTILIFVLAYLIGGIPWSYIVARACKGVDLRTIGSGNVGATNASRLFPGPWSAVAFAVCFSLDAAKGFLPAFFLAGRLDAGPLEAWSLSTRTLAVGLAAILGHIYTPYLRFRGGKGVATTLGVFLAAAPFAMLVAVAVGSGLILATRYVSVGSVAMGIVLPAVVIYRQPQEPVLCVLAAAAGAFIVFKHRSNLARLLQGRENRLFSPKSPDRGAASDQARRDA